jgi:hypothetical protein
MRLKNMTNDEVGVALSKTFRECDAQFEDYPDGAIPIFPGGLMDGGIFRMRRADGTGRCVLFWREPTIQEREQHEGEEFFPQAVRFTCPDLLPWPTGEAYFTACKAQRKFFESIKTFLTTRPVFVWRKRE